MAASAVASLARTAGEAALSAAKKYGPSVVQQAQQYLNNSGANASIASLAKGNNSQQAAVITALRKGGAPIEVLDGALRELTPEESVKWAGLVQSLREADARNADSSATPRSTSGDPGLDSVVRSRQIHKICGALAISSNELGELLTFFRSAQHSDIERYQRDFKILGLQAR